MLNAARNSVVVGRYRLDPVAEFEGPRMPPAARPDNVIEYRRAILLRCMSPVLAHRVISRHCTNSVAFRVKRTFSKPRLSRRIYEYAP